MIIFLSYVSLLSLLELSLRSFGEFFLVWYASNTEGCATEDNACLNSHRHMTYTHVASYSNITRLQSAKN